MSVMSRVRLSWVLLNCFCKVSKRSHWVLIVAMIEDASDVSDKEASSVYVFKMVRILDMSKVAALI